MGNRDDDAAIGCAILTLVIGIAVLVVSLWAVISIVNWLVSK